MFVGPISMKTASRGPHGAYSFEVDSGFFFLSFMPLVLRSIFYC